MAACASTPPASVEGLNKVFHDPGFAVQGKTRKDQVWISQTQETGIRVLGWKRPAKIVKAKARIIKPKPKPAPIIQEPPEPREPADFEGKPAEITPAPTPLPPTKVKPRKKHWWYRS